MKIFRYALDGYQADIFLMAIRSKKDVLSVWMNAIKVALAYWPVEAERVVAELVIVSGSMSRMFVVTERKLYSVNFPFYIRLNEEGSPVFGSRGCENIDNRVTSEILSLLDTSTILDHDDVLHFAEPICDACEIEGGLWVLLRELLTCEDGYLRYDYDDDPKRLDEKKHPLNHIDMFYSNGTTFKLGLHEKMGYDKMKSLIDVESNCHFLHMPYE
ncbi:TPA: hypothetical protein N2C35_000315 [Pseudomonas aeruginosa]|nr:hypothetical protein [Pseudomonas aeruginosa]